MSEEPREQNAIIESAEITNDDHGLLSAWVYLKYGQSGAQGFGGYALYLPERFTHSPAQLNFAGHFIWRVLEVAGVSEWSKLPGKTVRARSTWSKVQSIGHIVNDVWFDPQAEFARMLAAAGRAIS